MRTCIAALFLLLFFACKNKPQIVTESVINSSIDYPLEIDKVFDQHGGIELWNSMATLSYDMVRETSVEKQTIDLRSRHEKIEGSNFTSGWDGKEYWVEADTSYKGNAKFYTNLMFYFYAMPFVLGDEGINYEKSIPLEFEGIKYPGYRITYEDGIGISPKDEYFIHYDPKTYEMAWLGYTVTFFSGEKSEKISWIRYNDWASFEGLKLPNSLSWYKTEEGKTTELRNTRKFENINVSKTPQSAKTFQKTPKAKIIE